MTGVYLEVFDDTLVSTTSGIVNLSTILHRPEEQSLWAIAWKHSGQRNGISFHTTYGEAKNFKETQTCGSIHDGPIRLVRASDWLYAKVQEDKLYWANFSTFEDAATYNGEKIN